MKRENLKAEVYAMAYVLELELEEDDVENAILNDFNHCYLTVHETSKGDTVHYYDGMREGIAYYTENRMVETLLDEEAEDFCVNENIYMMEE